MFLVVFEPFFFLSRILGWESVSRSSLGRGQGGLCPVMPSVSKMKVDDFGTELELGDSSWEIKSASCQDLTTVGGLNVVLNWVNF